MKNQRRPRYWAYGAPIRENRDMRRTGSSEHFFTVRGRGFDTKQWRAILELAEGIVRRANEAGIKASYKGDARRVHIDPVGEGEPLVIWRKGEPGIPKNVKVSGDFDAVVQSILVATKKVAPDIFEMTTPDGRDYRRLLAKRNEKTIEEIKAITTRTREQKDDAFMHAVRRQSFRHPETKNSVEFVSLPKTEQTKIRHQWDAEYGRRWDTMAERAIRKVREAEKAKAEAKRDKDEAADAAKDFKQQEQRAQKGEGLQPRKALDMNDDLIRKAAIRVAHSTQDKALKHTLLEILKGTSPAPKKASSHDDNDKEKEGRHEEGKSVDVGDYLKSKGHEEDAAKWETHEGDMGKKSSAAVVFPEIHELAWRHVIDYSRANPKSKTASGSTAERMGAADRLAKKWIQDAIKHPGRVHEYLGVPEGDDIPMGKIDSAIGKVKGTGDKSLLSALELAKRLKGMNKKKGADDKWLNEESFTKAAAEVWGEEHLAKPWVQQAIGRHASLRGHLGLAASADIPMKVLSAAVGRAKKAGDKGLLSTLLLAKRLKGGQARAAA